MKLIDIIEEAKSNPIEDYFDSRAPYDSNNRGGTIDYFDYTEEHIMRFTRGKNLFVSPRFWEPLMEILKDKDTVGKEIVKWARKEFGNNEISSAILESTSGGYYATPNSKTIDPEAKVKHFMKNVYGYDPDDSKQIDRKQIILDKIEGFRENIKWALKSKHISVDRMIDHIEWSNKMIKKYTRILNKIDKPE
jgi:hypothetical protein